MAEIQAGKELWQSPEELPLRELLETLLAEEKDLAEISVVESLLVGAILPSKLTLL